METFHVVELLRGPAVLAVARHAAERETPLMGEEEAETGEYKYKLVLVHFLQFGTLYTLNRNELLVRSYRPVLEEVI